MSSRSTYDITFTIPREFAGEEFKDRSLNFHHIMKHTRDCHKQLLDFLISNDLLSETGEVTLIDDERRVVIDCTEHVCDCVRSLPFIASTEKARIVEAMPLQRRHKAQRH